MTLETNTSDFIQRTTDELNRKYPGAVKIDESGYPLRSDVDLESYNIGAYKSIVAEIESEFAKGGVRLNQRPPADNEEERQHQARIDKGEDDDGDDDDDDDEDTFVADFVVWDGAKVRISPEGLRDYLEIPEFASEERTSQSTATDETRNRLNAWRNVTPDDEWTVVSIDDGEHQYGAEEDPAPDIERIGYTDDNVPVLLGRIVPKRYLELVENQDPPVMPRGVKPSNADELKEFLEQDKKATILNRQSHFRHPDFKPRNKLSESFDWGDASTLEVTKKLRDGSYDELEDWDKELVDAVELDASPLSQDEVLWRGANQPTIYEVGQRFPLKSHESTSLVAEVAVLFVDNPDGVNKDPSQLSIPTLYQIRTPAGTPALVYRAASAEAVLLRGTEVEVLGVEDNAFVTEIVDKHTGERKSVPVRHVILQVIDTEHDDEDNISTTRMRVSDLNLADIPRKPDASVPDSTDMRHLERKTVTDHGRLSNKPHSTPPKRGRGGQEFRR